MTRRIYLASSWRNTYYPAALALLRNAGHEVYDFRNPAEGNDGFAWESIDAEWQSWSTTEYHQALQHPVAQEGYRHDKEALDWCDTLVLVLPCGRSAHLEAGVAIGSGKHTAMYWPDELTAPVEPELMYLLASNVIEGRENLLDWLSGIDALATPRSKWSDLKSLPAVAENS